MRMWASLVVYWHYDACKRAAARTLAKLVKTGKNGKGAKLRQEAAAVHHARRDLEALDLASEQLAARQREWDMILSSMAEQARRSHRVCMCDPICFVLTRYWCLKDCLPRNRNLRFQPLFFGGL